MPVSLVKVICAASLTGLTFSIISPYFGRTMRPLSQNQRLKVASGYFGKLHALDPAKITTMAEYEIIENLYGNLVEYDEQGRLIPDIPETFEWIGDDLIFTFGERARTKSGHVVTALDAATSLKRSILLKTSGHGDIRTFLCPNFDLKSIDDKCPGIQVEGNKLILTAQSGEARTYLMPMLESADFSILPRTALSADSRRPMIVDFTETSGAYRALENVGGSPLTLEVNDGYHRYHSTMASSVQFIQTSSADAGARLVRGEIDLLPASIYLSGPESVAILSAKDDFNVLESMPIRLYMLCFNPSTLKRFTVAQRMHVGRLLQQWAVANRWAPGSKFTSEFFQGLSDGSLSDAQRAEMTRLRDDNETPPFEEPIELSVIEANYESIKEFLKGHPEIRVTTGGTPAYLLPVDQKPDVHIITNDSAWTENVALLGHNFNVGTFHLPNMNGSDWIRSYVNTSDRVARIEKLRALHYDLLRSVVIYPMLVSPYLTVTRSTWTLPRTTISTGPELWKVRARR